MNEIGNSSVGARPAPTLFYLALAAVVIAAGLALRLVPIGLPTIVVKYGGSVLWAWMVYLLIAACLPRRSTVSVAVLATAVAALVELSRLYHRPEIDAFRLTRPGILLLGRVFSWWHFVVYGAAIALIAAADNAIRQRRQISQAD